MRLPPTFFLLSCISSLGFQLCLHFSLGKELSAIATYRKGITGCFTSSAQQRLRSFKAKEDTILDLHLMKQCVLRSPRVLTFPSPAWLSPLQTVPHSTCLTTTTSQPLRSHSVPATKVWVPLGQRATVMSELPVLNAASGYGRALRTVCCLEMRKPTSHTSDFNAPNWLTSWKHLETIHRHATCETG